MRIAETIGAGGFEPPTPCMSSKYSTPELRACKSKTWMRMTRYSKTCRYFVKAEFPLPEGMKTLKKQNVELFAGKSQYTRDNKRTGISPACGFS